MTIKRSTVGLAIAAATLVAGIGLFSFWLATRCTIPPTRVVLADEVSAAHTLIQHGLQFQNPTFICGTNFGEEFYEPQKDIGVAIISEGFASPDDAKSEFRSRIRHAVTILERGPKIDHAGRQDGERVVAILSPCRPSRSEAAILWLHDRTITTIEAPSLRYAIAYELSAK